VEIVRGTEGVHRLIIRMMGQFFIYNVSYERYYFSDGNVNKFFGYFFYRLDQIESEINRMIECESETVNLIQLHIL